MFVPEDLVVCEEPVVEETGHIWQIGYPQTPLEGNISFSRESAQNWAVLLCRKRLTHDTDAQSG